MTSGRQILTTNTASALTGTTDFNVRFRAANVDHTTAFMVESVSLSQKMASALATVTAPGPSATASHTLVSSVSMNLTTFATRK